MSRRGAWRSGIPDPRAWSRTHPVLPESAFKGIDICIAGEDLPFLRTARGSFAIGSIAVGMMAVLLVSSSYLDKNSDEDNRMGWKSIEEDLIALV
jgi:hypothetical protein